MLVSWNVSPVIGGRAASALVPVEALGAVPFGVAYWLWASIDTFRQTLPGT
ncbi:hypothetical protein GCM10009784_24290 [Arthrobacter parietis]|uniref:Uncharacterized protein n=1 Tax=Arthrobacter parietis TaxID=271434 RepID=A0ABP5MTD4_9MICC